MKLSQQTGLALLVCSLGGLALSVWLGRGLMVLETNAQQLGPNSVALRDIDHLKASVCQWFITVDLVFVDNQTYLAEGVAEQAVDLDKIFVDLAQTRLAEKSRGLIKTSRAQLNQITKNVTESAMWSAQQRDDRLNDVINASDTASVELFDALDLIADQLSESSQQAVIKLETERAQFEKTAIISGILYLLLVVAVWRWMTVRVVRPVVQLTVAADQAVDTVEGFEIKEQGPREIRVLTRNIRTFVGKIDTARRLAQEQNVKAEEAAARIQAIMDTAPDAIITIDSKEAIVMFNQAALLLFQFNDQRLDGQDVSRFVPEYSGIRSNIDASAGETIEVEALRDSGDPFPAELSISPVKLKGRTHVIAVLRDITARKVAEKEMHRLNKQLVDTSRQAGMAEVASGVLHNVGNVLTSVNVTATTLNERVRQMKIPGLSKAAELMGAHASDLATFMTEDDRGKKLPLYLNKLAEAMTQEQAVLLEDIDGLAKNIEHIKQVVSSQQQFARVQDQICNVDVKTLIDDAIEVNELVLRKSAIHINNEEIIKATVFVNQHQALQILVNLIKNACDAMDECALDNRQLTVAATLHEKKYVRFSVTDTGSGIAPENLNQVFTHGFTTKADGHGFGLHSSANTAKQMGGALIAESDGAGCGATFHLDLPVAQEKEALC